MSTATEQFEALDREQWKRDRLRGLGASEWTTVLGVNPNKSRYALACEKLGEIEPENIDDRDNIIFGRLMEPLALGELARRTGRIVSPWPQDQVIVSPSHDFLFCTPDAMQHDQQRGEGVAEAKNQDAHVSHVWRDAPPLIHQVQVQAQLFVTGRTWGTICVVLGGNRFAHFDVERDDRFIAAALPVLETFWSLIKSGKKPDFDGTESCKRAIGRMYPEDNGEAIALDASFETKYAELTALKKCQGLLADRRDLLENEIKLAIGDNTDALLPNGERFSWKQQSRTVSCPHCLKIISESSFRVLRQHKAKGIKPLETISGIVATATAALIAHGAVLCDESESGSRYFELAGGLVIRLADHAPNEKTADWIDRREVASIRVDQADWRDSLEAITGPMQIPE